MEFFCQFHASVGRISFSVSNAMDSGSYGASGTSDTSGTSGTTQLTGMFFHILYN